MSTPISPERVLPTLNADGTRNRIRPRLYEGRLYRARRAVAYTLMALFIFLPRLRIHGKPVMLLDVLHRQFVLFGHTYLPTDGVLLMLLLLSIFVTIVLVTALVGRAWCGWGCPQTVYMEFLFRPIERLFEGPREAQLRLDKAGLSGRRLAKNGVYLALSFLLANVFLAYFVGTDALEHWVLEAPSEHLGGFSVVLVTTGLVFFDFAYFREQMCTVVCPYARLQSVLLDPKSLLIGYDARRGEPRSKGKAKTAGHGDCIDCQACVVSCPTGIDIRQGLQLECIACGQCADACDSIMDRIKKPRGLIRYSSQRALESGQTSSKLRVRVVIYAVVLAGLLASLLLIGRSRPSAEVTVLRGLGAPFSQNGDDVINQLRLKVTNRGEKARDFSVQITDMPEARLIAPELPLHVAPSEQASVSFFVVAPQGAVHGSRRIHLRVGDASGGDLTTYTLLGPEGDAGP
ncbi:MAG TPA: cytochrome c oxidase accessory protein CcoG [Polyangiaceae bacterium]|nr:cytochrome c oxidase accessory protein CcoG [Polyangiaceae bacterium]